MIKRICALFLLISSPLFLFSQNLDLEEIFNSSSDDLNDYIITDDYTSKNIRHVYFRQAVDGIELYGANADAHFKNGSLVNQHNQFLQGIKKYPKITNVNFSPLEIIQQVCQQKNYPDGEIRLIQQKAKSWEYESKSISNEIIKVRKVYYRNQKNQLELAYQFAIDETVGSYYIDFIASANTGQILKEINWTVNCKHETDHVCNNTKEHSPSHLRKINNNRLEKSNALVANSYRVFPWPMEDPFDGDRTLEINPELDNIIASPEGWHQSGTNSWTHTRGNNTDAYEDTNDSDGPSSGNGSRVDGGGNLEFDFPLDTSGTPVNFQDAAITNLFYWNNVLHDVWFNYGFDEPSGNFQRTNYTGTGAGGDYVQAEALHPGQCNAFFSSPSDGNRGRMEMYVCGAKDGDYDNVVIAHEFGHGISIRLTGGPGTSGCLGNQEQMGEGWSDWFGVVMTIQPPMTGATPRPVGNYLFQNGPNGPGIRPFPYSTDMSINPMTYASSFSGVSVPHGVGSVWATMLYDMTWKLIDQYGFDPDIYNGTGGNNIAMALVIEGLKQQPCSPGFVDGRDGILMADQLLFNGANQCLIWEAFANRGLGFSADQGSSNNRSDGTEAFDMPPACTVLLDKTVDQTNAAPGAELTYTIKVKNISGIDQTDFIITDDLPDSTSFVYASNGGSESSGVVSWPAFDLLNGDSTSVELTVQIDPTINPFVDNFNDDMESGPDNFTNTATGSTDWNYQNSGANSGSFVWFANDGSSPGEANLTLSIPVGLDQNSVLTFNHLYDTEATWDGGLVLISIDNGASWTDLGPNMITNGYNSTIFQAFPGFSGNSNGYITTTVDLSPYAFNSVLINFRMICDQFVGGNGWFIDDVELTNLAKLIPNEAVVSNGTITSKGSLETPTKVTPNIISLDMSSTNASCGQSNGSATATASGGSGDYRYQWSNGGETATINNLSAGVYVVTVTENSNTLVDSIEVLEGGSQLVTNIPDNQAGSLRSIINNACNGDTIYFDAALMNQTVMADQGEIIIDKTLTIIGLGLDNLFIDAGGNNRIFHIQNGADVFIENITFQNANEDPDGGAILNEGILNLKNIKFLNNLSGANPRSITNKGTGSMNILENVILEE